MRKEKDKRSGASHLRQKAEAMHKKKTAHTSLPPSDTDMKKLLHELEVHQIELEMQNDELERARAAANELAEKYIELYDHAPTGYLTLSASGEILQLNFACARMLGEERSRVMKNQFRQYVSSDTRPAFDQFFTRIVEAAAAASCDAVLSTGGDRSIYVHLTGILSADAQHVMITLVDISERKESEDKLLLAEQTYHGILDRITEVVYIEDEEGKILDVNRAAEKMFGYEKDQLIGRTLDFLVAKGKNEIVQLQSHYTTALRDGQHSFELMGRHKNGSLFPVEVSLSLGNYFGREVIIAVARDITHRKEMDQLMSDVQRREAIGVLSAGIAHDFNNLLAVMMGNISLAQSKLAAQHPAYPLMEHAELAMKRAAELTEQILAYSGKGKHRTETLDLRGEIEQYISLFTISIPKNVRLTTQLPETPIYVSGDPGQIKQIIMNLISNGADAIGDKQGAVSINLREMDLTQEQLIPYSRITNTILSEGRYAVLEIRDSGSGMSKETIATIFDPFFTTKFTGRGLGLSAVLGIIRGHDGGISIESKEGIGSVFSVILPVSEPESIKMPAPEEPSEPAERAKKTVLIIDDESEVASMAKELLETADYTVLMELDPVRAIDRFKERHNEIDVVLLDWTMPVLSGKEVAEALGAIDSAVRIIISSGYSPDDIKTKIDAAIVSGFLQKPYTLRGLLATVESVVK